MTGKVGNLAQRKAARVADAEPFLGLWGPVLVAPVLSALLPQAVSADQLRRRAVALGLVREPPPGHPCELTAWSLSRLLLAGYRLPAQVEQGNSHTLRTHVREGRRVFVLLDARECDHAAAAIDPLRICQILDLPAETGFLSEVLLSQPGRGETGQFRLPLPIFLQSWSGPGRLLIVAARAWADLPREGDCFFGGNRGKDGVYHWDTAECDTTADGEVLR